MRWVPGGGVERVKIMHSCNGWAPCRGSHQIERVNQVTVRDEPIDLRSLDAAPESMEYAQRYTNPAYTRRWREGRPAKRIAPQAHPLRLEGRAKFCCVPRDASGSGNDRGDVEGNLHRRGRYCADRTDPERASATLTDVSPTVSVVIPTYNRAARLSKLLDGLAAQVGDEDFEVIVVDDASADGTVAMLERRKAELPYHLVILSQSVNAGPAAARNRGWQMAEADIVCFTDDDCVPAPGWLAAMVTAMAAADLVQGETQPAPDQYRQAGPFSRTLRVDWEFGYYETCNMAYRREVLVKHDGFDESFRYPYGEDTDLAWRAKDGGAESMFESDALVYHDVFESDWRACLREVRRREGLVQLYHRRPGLRRRLGKGVFCHQRHPPALAATLCALTLLAKPRSRARWGITLACGLWYAAQVRLTRWGSKRYGPISWLVVVPASYIVDMAEMAVLARASARYRILQL